MKVDIVDGQYVIAVSGGVDSMVLLDLLAKKPGIGLIVAHFNHGIREDSDKDEDLVRQSTKKLNLPFEVGHGFLDPRSGEATARQARYGFLHSVRDIHHADSIITAHHLDDYLETALINLIRGTGRKGFSAISSNNQIQRPLLKYEKSEILAYAKVNGVKWLQDETNGSNDYVRNYLRNEILKRQSKADKRQMIKNIDKVAKIDKSIDSQIAKISQYILVSENIDRVKFSGLPSQIGDELVLHWLRQKGLADIDRKTVHRTSQAIKTSRANTTCTVKSNLSLVFTAKTARFIPAI